MWRFDDRSNSNQAHYRVSRELNLEKGNEYVGFRCTIPRATEKERSWVHKGKDPLKCINRKTGAYNHRVKRGLVKPFSNDENMVINKFINKNNHKNSRRKRPVIKPLGDELNRRIGNIIKNSNRENSRERSRSRSRTPLRSDKDISGDEKENKEEIDRFLNSESDEEDIDIHYENKHKNKPSLKLNKRSFGNNIKKPRKQKIHFQDPLSKAIQNLYDNENENKNDDQIDPFNKIINDETNKEIEQLKR